MTTQSDLPGDGHERPRTAVEAHGKAMQIKIVKAEKRLARGEATPADLRRLGLDRQPVARMAHCPEHGLHGERERCFECGREVDHPAYVAARWVVTVALLTLVVGCVIGLVL